MFNLIQPITFIFLLAIAFLTVMSIFFFCKKDESKISGKAYLVTSTTVVSYLLMLSGAFTTVSAQGEIIYYTRWPFYILSCSILMYTMAQLFKKSASDTLQIIYLNTLVMLTGAVASVVSGPYNWLIFTFGSLFFIAQIYILFKDVKNADKKKLVASYVFTGWVAFPIVFALAPEGFGIISTLEAAALYFSLDTLTKVVFYLHLISKKY